MSPFYAGREVSLEWLAIGGIDYVIIPSFFDAVLESNYWLSFYTLPQSTVTEIKSPSESSITPTEEGMSALSVQSAWVKGKSSGGSPSYGSWIQSPQFILKVPSKDTVQIELKSLTKDYTGLFVFKSEPAQKRKFTATDIVYQSKFTKSEINSVSIPFEPGSYNILCCTLTPDVEAKFTLTVTGHFTDTKQLIEMTEETDWQKSSISGKWITGQSGGCSNNVNTWMQNPMFKLEVGEKSIVKIVLNAEVPAAAGYYLFSTKDDKVNELIGKSTFAKPQAGHAISTGNWTLEPATYFVLPATFNPDVQGSFVIDFYSDHKVCTLSSAQ